MKNVNISFSSSTQSSSLPISTGASRSESLLDLFQYKSMETKVVMDLLWSVLHFKHAWLWRVNLSLFLSLGNWPGKKLPLNKEREKVGFSFFFFLLITTCIKHYLILSLLHMTLINHKNNNPRLIKFCYYVFFIKNLNLKGTMCDSHKI